MTEQQQASLKDKMKDRAENGTTGAVVKKELKPTFTNFLAQAGVKAKIADMAKDSKRFVSAIASAVSTTPALADCDYGTILSAALLGEGLNLTPSPQLGQYYIVPFEDTKNNRKVATFVLGYKGMLQLAIRSGLYKKINVISIKEGELKSIDPINEEITCMLIEDHEARERAKTIGYYAFFEHINGFRKPLYWSREQMEAHAEKYSAGYRADKKRGTAYTFWSKNFDDMAHKTMIRQLISKWGVMSIELEKGYLADTALIKGEDSYEYVDNVEDADYTTGPMGPIDAEIVQ